jgi:RNA polymerase sigma-70 factor (ECF subfamily)
MTVITTMENDDDKAFMLSLYKDYYGLVRKTIYNTIHDSDYSDYIEDLMLQLAHNDQK